MSRTRRILALVALALVAAVAGAVTMASPAAADDSEQYLIPDPGMWCYDFAARQMGNAVGINYHYVGMTGSKAANDLKCKIVISVNLQERGGRTWYGWSGTLPPAYFPVDFRDACMKQYGNDVGLKWLDAGPAPGWYCVGQSGTYYDQSSRVGY